MNYIFLDLYFEVPKVGEATVAIKELLKSAQVGDRLNLVGPYGTGLRLTHQFLASRPHIAIFVEGIYVVKYLDLVYYKLAQQSKALPSEESRSSAPVYTFSVVMFIHGEGRQCVGIEVINKCEQVSGKSFQVVWSGEQLQNERAQMELDGWFFQINVI